MLSISIYSIPIPAGAPITVAIKMLPVVIDKTINKLRKKSKKTICLLSLLLINSLYLISGTK